MPEAPFALTGVDVGDRVEYCRDPSWNATTVGLVGRVTDRYADVIVFAGGRAVTRPGCLHREDPRCDVNRSELFGAEGTAGGVFQLAASELRIKELDQRLAAIERLQTEMQVALKTEGDRPESGKLMRKNPG